MKKYLSIVLCFAMLSGFLPMAHADDVQAVLTSNGGERVKSGYTLTAELIGVDDKSIVSTIFEYSNSKSGAYTVISGDDTSDNTYVIENSMSSRYIRAKINTDDESYITDSLFCGANLTRPTINADFVKTKSVEKTPEENKLSFSDGNLISHELVLLSTDEEKTMLMAPVAPYIPVYEDSEKHQILSATDEKSIIYKINQDDYISKYVLPDSMQEYLITTMWETEAGYKSADADVSNMQNDSVFEARVAPISINEYAKYASKIGFNDDDIYPGMLMRTPADNDKLQFLAIQSRRGDGSPYGQLTVTHAYSKYFKLRPVFYVKNEIFDNIKLTLAGKNVRNMFLSKYSIPELIEMGYTEDELVSLGFDTSYPTCSNAYVAGACTVGSTLKAEYTYTHSGGTAEGESVFTWYREDKYGRKSQIYGEDKNTYTLTDEDLGFKISYTVLPFDTNSSRGYICESASTDTVTDDFAVSFDNFVLNADGTASVDYTFSNINGKKAKCVLAVYSGYKLSGVDEISVTDNGIHTLAVNDACENAYAKTFVINEDTNMPVLLLAKNTDLKPDINVDENEDYYFTADSQNEIYIIGGKNADAGTGIVCITISEKDTDKVIYSECEFVSEGIVKYCFSMPDGASVGDYTAGIYSRKLSEPSKIDFHYSSLENKLQIIDEISPVESGEKFAATIYDRMDDLEITDKYMLGMTESELAYIGDKLKGKSYGKDNITKFYSDLSDQSAIYQITRLKTGEEIIKCVQYYKDRFNFERSSLYSEYKGLNDSEKIKLLSMFYGKTADTFADVLNIFEQNIVLNKINTASSYGKVHKYLTDYESVIPFSLADYKKSDTAKASLYIFKNGDYTSMDKLEKAVKTAVASSDNNSSGSSGSSSRGSGKVTLTAEVPKTDIPGTVKVFGDMDSTHWAYKYIFDLKQRNIISGDENNNFNPEASITREEFVKLAVEAFNLSDSDALCSYNDVDSSHWSYKYVAAASKLGIVNGMGNGKFGLGSCITREDMAVIISKIKKLSYTGTSTGFSDSAEISDYAAEAVNALSQSGVINGFEDGSFRPKAFATRSQAAKIIYNLINANQ